MLKDNMHICPVCGYDKNALKMTDNFSILFRRFKRR